MASDQTVSPVEPGGIDPGEREAHTRFVRERWETLAALAWDFFQAEGRGAVVLEVVSTEGEGRTEAFFISEQALRAKGRQWPDADTARMVAEYQPEREIVVVVPRECGGSSTYQLAAMPTPPVVARQRERAWRKPPSA